MNNKFKKILKCFIFPILILILIISIGVGIYGYNMYSRLNVVQVSSTDIGIDSDTNDELANYNNFDNVTNIALFGVDATDTTSGRSDCIMILSIDNKNKELKVSSIMRDSYVNIPGYGMDKINHAFAFGNSALALQTINQNFGLNIDKFIATDFNSLPQIVDAINGVDINITDEEISHIPGINASGIHTLAGSQALSYSRIRYATAGDYQRTARQRTVLNAIYKKALTVPKTEYPKLLNEFLPLIETNLKADDILTLGNTALSFSNTTLTENRFPEDSYCNGETIDGVYYLTLDIEETKNQIRNFIYNKSFTSTMYSLIYYIFNKYFYVITIYHFIYKYLFRYSQIK